MEHINFGHENKLKSISPIRLNYETPAGMMLKYRAQDMRPNRGPQTGTLTDYGLHKPTYYTIMDHN